VPNSDAHLPFDSEGAKSLPKGGAHPKLTAIRGKEAGDPPFFRAMVWPHKAQWAETT